NNVGPIFMIASTNHALDHMFGFVPNADITIKVVLWGSHSPDEKISQYLIDTLEKVNKEYCLNSKCRKKISKKVSRA
ncbi:hypothetical protein C8R48DRAFT_616866, partial [Suillus tomentosus]